MLKDVISVDPRQKQALIGPHGIARQDKQINYIVIFSHVRVISCLFEVFFILNFYHGIHRPCFTTIWENMFDFFQAP